MKDFLIASSIWGGFVAGAGTLLGLTLTLGLAESFADKVARKVVDDIQKTSSFVSSCSSHASDELPGLENSDGVAVLEPQTVPLSHKPSQYLNTIGREPIYGAFDFSSLSFVDYCALQFPKMKCSQRCPECPNNRRDK